MNKSFFDSIRNIFPPMPSLKDLIQVQPMNLPSGLIFYLDFKYGGWDFYKNMSLLIDPPWLEDGNDGGYYCPVVDLMEDPKFRVGDYWKLITEFQLLIPRWEIDMMETGHRL